MKVLFVCTGNTCRSPMAETLYRSMGGDAASAGLCAAEGAPASLHARAVMAERGLSLEGHRARRLTGDLIAGADMIVPMSESHAAAIRRLYPEAAARVRVFGAVPDPFGGSLEDYRQCADMIEDMLTEIKGALPCC